MTAGADPTIAGDVVSFVKYLYFAIIIDNTLL